MKRYSNSKCYYSRKQNRLCKFCTELFFPSKKTFFSFQGEVRRSRLFLKNKKNKSRKFPPGPPHVNLNGLENLFLVLYQIYFEIWYTYYIYPVLPPITMTKCVSVRLGVLSNSFLFIGLAVLPELLPVSKSAPVKMNCFLSIFSFFLLKISTKKKQKQSNQNSDDDSISMENSQFYRTPMRFDECDECRWKIMNRTKKQTIILLTSLPTNFTKSQSTNF